MKLGSRLSRSTRKSCSLFCGLGDVSLVNIGSHTSSTVLSQYCPLPRTTYPITPVRHTGYKVQYYQLDRCLLDSASPIPSSQQSPGGDPVTHFTDEAQTGQGSQASQQRCGKGSPELVLLKAVAASGLEKKSIPRASCWGNPGTAALFRFTGRSSQAEFDPQGYQVIGAEKIVWAELTQVTPASQQPV